LQLLIQTGTEGVYMPCRLVIVGVAAAGFLALSAGCQRESKPVPPAVGGGPVAILPAPRAHSGGTHPSSHTENTPRFVGSKSCRDCHEDFYKLWATSFHGLAMQPYTPAFGRKDLVPQTGWITIGKTRYQMEIDDRGGRVRQHGPDGEKTYPIEHVMGGKNVYYFLTRLERGRLQVLPLAYDVHQKAWYDMAASGVRHFPDRRDEALDWTDRMFAFNTTCFNCHVTELATNYDLATDTYHTTWSEPGISCESCHGSAKEHVRVMDETEDLEKVKDLKIIRAKKFTPAQMNDMCATCHAKFVPLSLDFLPGDKFFDHFDLVVLDHPDYYPDGRDLGENYTCTSWMMSPCANSGKLDCNHCHTPSGRPRFTGTEASKSCAPCHQKHLDDPTAHSHHVAGSKGNDCVGCHMPMTRFAAMGRTDHSMLPPTPAATIAFQSPNACNLCHADKDAAWSDSWVRKWYPRDYQAPVMERASLLDAARKRDWKRLPQMLDKIARPEENAIYKASLIRLVRGCQDGSKWPVLLKALADKSPLVRSSAASSLGSHLDGETILTLLAASRDPFRLVRIRAAMALAPIPAAQLQDSKDRESLERAVEEFKTAMKARPDDWAGHANLGDFYMEQRDFQKAVDCFETATRLEPRMIGPMVNVSMAYSNLQRNDKAESSLRRALQVEPGNPAALFNLGLLLAEEQRPKDAEEALRAALKGDPQMAAAAFNLGVLCGKARIDEAVQWCRKAHELEPGNAKYAHTLAFFLRQKGNVDEAIQLLRQVVRREPLYLDAYLLLGEIYEERHDYSAAAAGYRDALKLEQLPPPVRRQLESKVRAIEARNR
jgi:tetratricopeptide (TPR) repeat protein